MKSSRMTHFIAPQGSGREREGDGTAAVLRVGALLLTMLLVTGCAPRVTEPVPVPRSDLTLDLPLEPSSPSKSRPPQLVQTEPPPLGSLRTERHAIPSAMPPPGTVKEFGIPARDPAASPAVYAPVSGGSKAAVAKKKSTVKKKAVSKKKKPLVKKRKTSKRAAAPCVPAPAK
ncbi:MAG: hypothetical protein HQM06_10420 [Magnetococcales bacterium]|nr:hypothetical protein [Magnetococcales bacterium]